MEDVVAFSKGLRTNRVDSKVTAFSGPVGLGFDFASGNGIFVCGDHVLAGCPQVSEFLKKKEDASNGFFMERENTYFESSVVLKGDLLFVGDAFLSSRLLE